jgi:AcrR family transcriptional regulator
MPTPAATEARRGSTRSTRAKPLSPPERRAAIIEATVPLLRSRGPAVTTKEIADAAGVAEGTIFGVFPDKEALLDEAIKSALDPAPIKAQIAAIDLDLDLEQRLIRAVEIIQAHLGTIWALTSTVGLSRLVAEREDTEQEPRSLAWETLAPVIAPDEDRLSRAPSEAARALLGLAWASCHPMLVGDSPTPASEVVALLLDGIRARHRSGTRR